MIKTFEIIKELVSKNEVKISTHGYDEMSEYDIFIKDVIADVGNGIVIENYDKYPKGRCVLVLEKDIETRFQYMWYGVFPKENLLLL